VLDADDWWAPNKLRVQVDTLVKANACFCFAGFVSVSGGERTVRVHPPQWMERLGDHLRAENCILHSSVVMRRDTFLAVDGYDTALLSAHDWDFHLKVLRREGPGAFVYVDEPLVYYRVHGEGITAKWRRMMADERVIVRRSLFTSLWCIRHPVAARYVLGEQLGRELGRFRRAGELGAACRSAAALAVLHPQRRWAWREMAALATEWLSAGRTRRRSAASTN
jgi:hypothetical protein